MSQTPSIIVAAIIIEPRVGGIHILLTQVAAGPFTGFWCLPSGHPNDNETWPVAVCREVRDKIGVSFYPCFFGSFPGDTSSPGTSVEVKVFHGAYSGAIIRNPHEVSAVRWFPLEQALSLHLASGHHDILSAYQSRIVSDGFRQELLAEYAALRAESVQRMDLRQQALNLALTGAGVFIGFAAGDVADPVVLLLFPWLVLPLAIMWSHHDVRLGQLGDHVRQWIEPFLSGLNWEGSLRERHLHLPWTRGATVEFATLGILVGVNIVCIATAFLLMAIRTGAGQQVAHPLAYIMLAALAIAPTVATYKVVRRRRDPYRKLARSRRKKKQTPSQASRKP